MATHAERLALAYDVSDALLKRHGTRDLIAIGLHGSVARGNDDEASDIDFAVITARPEVIVPDRIRRVRGIIVDVGAITGEAYLEEARHVGPQWPVASDQYGTTFPLHDPTGYFALLADTHRRAMAEAPDWAFMEAAALNVMGALGGLNLTKRYLSQGQPSAARVALHDTTVAIALTLGLLKRRTATNAARLVASVATEDWGLPEVTVPFTRAVATSDLSTAHAALATSFESLRTVCATTGIVWDTDDVQVLVD
jgi:hypothetical protein